MSSAVERAASRRQHAACVSAIEAARSHAQGLWDALAEVHRLEAWRITGHISFTDWAQEALDVSRSQSYRYLAKAREAIAIAEQTGVSTDEAAETVTLRSKSGAKSPDPRPEVVDQWAKPVKAAIKLSTSISHLKVAGPLNPSTRTALEQLLQSIEAVLRAPESEKGVANGCR